MADERNRDRGARDELEQDGLGRDAAHGGGPDATTGGSYGRSTGRAGDGDLLATGQGSGQGSGQESGGSGMDDATDRQREAGARREGLEGKGFDAGTGYGGGGNASAYSGESSYGGQSGLGGNRMRGAYSGEDYGRLGEDAREGGTSGGSGGASIPRGPDEQSPDDGSDTGGRRASGGGDDVDLDARPEATRRDPTR